MARVAIQALAAVLGGTQSLHTNSLDEALALPSEQAVTVALRTQQIIAEESGVTNTVDPLGGSFFIETLTNEMEQQATDYFRRIEQMGGVIPAIEQGFFQREIAESAARYQWEIDSGQRIIVGVNEYDMEEEVNVPLLQMDQAGYQRQVDRLQRVRAERDPETVQRTLAALDAAAQRPDVNLMPVLLDAVNAYATLQEMMDVLRQVWGEYREPLVV